MMKLWAVLSCTPLLMFGGAAHAKTKLNNLTQKASYSIGVNIGQNFRQQGAEVDVNVLLEGMQHGLKGTDPLLKPEDMRKALQEFGAEVKKKLTAKRKADGEKNKKKGTDFLAKNKKAAGVKTLPSGLQYKVVKQGKGPKPKLSDTVVTHYRGTLIDGSEFDSSITRGQPATFPVDGVIKGWTEALQLMPKGSKWQLFIPAELAYGERGSGPRIGPFATLIFDIELIDIKKNEKK